MVRDWRSNNNTYLITIIIPTVFKGKGSEVRHGSLFAFLVTNEREWQKNNYINFILLVLVRLGGEKAKAHGWSPHSVIYRIQRTYHCRHFHHKLWFPQLSRAHCQALSTYRSEHLITYLYASHFEFLSKLVDCQRQLSQLSTHTSSVHDLLLVSGQM